MISFVRGSVAALDDDSLIIDVGGVGLAVSVPLSKLEPRPVIGGEYILRTHLQVREDAWTLYGFTDLEQLRMFRLLLNVSGVGAKTALIIVDKLGATRFSSVVANKDIKALTAVPGIGKKTAERIILELKDKLIVLPQSDVTSELGDMTDDSEPHRGLLAALRQLGYSATESRAFALQAQAESPEASTEQLLRDALKIAMKA